MIDEHLQDRVLACMQRVPEFIAVASPHLRAEYFDGIPRQNVCKIMVDFWKDYSTTVTATAFITILNSLVTDGKIKASEIDAHVNKWKKIKVMGVTDWKFTLDKLVSFIKHQRIKSLIDESVKKHLPSENYAAIEKEMAKIASINAQNRVQAYDYFDPANIESRQKARAHELKHGKIAISTGIKPLDDKLHAGGFYQKELYIFMAPPKTGKTMSLLWFSSQASLQGYNVAHFTCEVSEEVCSKRLDAMISRTKIREVTTYNEAVADRIRGKAASGKLMVFEYPTKFLTSQMIEAKLDSLLSEQGIKVDMLVIDYLDICKCIDADRSSSWSDQGPIAQEFRGLGGKFCIPVVTATQINRGGAGKSNNSGKDVAGDFGKIMIADEVYSLSGTEEELKAGKLRITNTESRNSETGTVVISTAFAYGQFFQEYLSDEI